MHFDYLIRKYAIDLGVILFCNTRDTALLNSLINGRTILNDCWYYSSRGRHYTVWKPPDKKYHK